MLIFVTESVSKMWPVVILVWLSAPFGLSCTPDLQFPSWFKFGASTSSYQIEGAWNVSDKAESKWDRLTHTIPETFKQATGDVACDSYRLWRRDIEMIEELGLQFYRFSISWPRLLPSGFPNIISEDGKRYYNNLIDGLLEKGIEPVVTIYHFEMPEIFQELGGWTNPLISDWYADYARVVFSLFGDRVKTWITINEPSIECDYFHTSEMPYNAGLEHGVASYMCNKYVLIAHAKAWRIYDTEFRHKYNGKVSFSNHLLWLYPSSPEYEELTEISREFISGRYCHAVYSKEGGWPPVVEENVAKFGRKIGYTRTRLPPFTKEEIELVRGTYDYFGLNYYTTRLVRPSYPGESVNPSVFFSVIDVDAVFDIDPDWRNGLNKLLPIHPIGLRQQMEWVQKHYGEMEFIISENGYSSTGSNLNDYERISFIKDHLEQVLMSINEGINVTKYSYWGLMDDFEWLDGYRSNFGLYEVDFSDVNRTRTPRKSAAYYSGVIRNRSLCYEPTHIDINTIEI
ncbi:myrosinase 1-like [Anticarsia gemmatalis]|uniref:myrosinase 1-like n=1 Tax=Anticarsia gemmatalis TaxID=129554 RepID=UPI003F766774